jgi:quinol---cytochrome c reductase cytochrome c subunit, bacillus type
VTDQKTFVAGPGTEATRTPVRVLVVQGDERPPVDVTDEPMVMTVPHLVVRELIAFLGLSLVLIVLSLVANAPLEEIADGTRTPNPAKAPWYFLGLQELLHYYPPLVSGVVLPGLLVVALVVVPYFRINLQRPPLPAEHRLRTLLILWSIIVVLGGLSYTTGAQPVWPFIGTLVTVGAVITVGVASRSQRRSLAWLRARSLAFWIFSWFLLTATVLTVIGVFFRGPGWAFTLPWRDGIYY